MHEYLEDWKVWYSEIKAGRSTFRFIGDDTEYDLRGPVRRGGGMERGRTEKRIPAEPLTDKAKSKDASREFRFIPYLVALLFFLGGLVIYLRTQRRAA